MAALQQNHLAKESELYIFSDAAKSPEDEQTIQSVRAFVNTIGGFKSIHIFEAKKNKGLGLSIISGVTQVLLEHDKVIVLEDDLRITPNFLLFMNSCLNAYQHEPKVFSVSGYSFDLGKDDKERYDAYFLNRGWSWGWATWKDRWEKVDWEVKDYALFIQDIDAQKEFSKGGSDLNKMLSKQMSGKLDSWAIRWFYHQFRSQGLTVYPVLSKVYNEGFDEDATHTIGSVKRYIPILDNLGKHTFMLPTQIVESSFYQREFQKKMGKFARLKSKLETILKTVSAYVQDT